MLISVIPEQFQEIGNKILNKCAKQGTLCEQNAFFYNCFIIISSTPRSDSVNVSDGADACEKIYEVAKCVQGTVPEVNRFIVSSQ